MGAAMPVVEEATYFLSSKVVMERLGVSRSKLLAMRRDDPDFPQPFNIGPGTGRQAQLRWVEHELEAWMRDRMSTRRT